MKGSKRVIPANKNALLPKKTLKPLKRQRIFLCQVFRESIDEIGFTFKDGVIADNICAGIFADVQQLIAHLFLAFHLFALNQISILSPAKETGNSRKQGGGRISKRVVD